MPELEAVKAYVCDECGYTCDGEEAIDRGPVYECDCGEVFTRDDTDAGNHKCPSCSKFGRKRSDISCPDCNTGGLEQVDAFRCSECNALFAEKPCKKESKSKRIFKVSDEDFTQTREAIRDKLLIMRDNEDAGIKQVAINEILTSLHKMVGLKW